MRAAAEPCPVCGHAAGEHDAVDFNKSCEEARGTFLPRSGRLVRYHLCAACGFCFAPEFRAWSERDFAERIYNAGYAAVDPDYADLRPRSQARGLLSLFNRLGRPPRRHLDYGAGSGLLSRLLAEGGWDSQPFDPFGGPPTAQEPAGTFDLVTAFEVFEHVVDVRRLLECLLGYMAPDGVVLSSTLVSDGAVAAGRPLDWWYAAPRNGHISLHSRRSLAALARGAACRCVTLSADLHVFYRDPPAWAAPLLRAARVERGAELG